MLSRRKKKKLQNELDELSVRHASMVAAMQEFKTSAEAQLAKAEEERVKVAQQVEDITRKLMK